MSTPCPAGSPVVSDSYAGAVIKVANPNNVSTCTVSVLAGNATVSAGFDPSVTSTLPAYVVTDGAGTAARFDAVGALVVDDQDDVYVVDSAATDGQGKALLRKIDSAGNVTTVLRSNRSPPEATHLALELAVPARIGAADEFGSSAIARSPLPRRRRLPPRLRRRHVGLRRTHHLQVTPARRQGAP